MNMIKRKCIAVLSFIAAVCMVLALLWGIMPVSAASEDTQVSELGSITVAQQTVRMEMIDGAYIRTEQPAGLRFVTYLALEDYNALVTQFGEENLELGTEVAAAGETGNIITEKATVIDDEIMRFAAVITDIPENMYGEQVTAKAYITVNGEKVFTQNSVTRSVKETAAAALSAPLTYTNDQRLMLEGYAGVTDNTADTVSINIALEPDLKAALGSALETTVNFVFDSQVSGSGLSAEFTGEELGQKTLTVYTDQGILRIAVNIISFASGFTNISTLAGMDILDAETGLVKTATGLEYVEFDGHSGATFFIVDFVGKNAPNFAAGAVAARSEITLVGNDEWTDSGCFMWNSSPARSCYSGLYVTRGFRDNSNTAANVAAISGTANAGPGLMNFEDDTRYIMIVGYEPVEGGGPRNANIYVKIFTVDEEGTLSLVCDKTAQAPTVTHIAEGNKAVIYGNVIHPGLGTAGVTFGYEEPAASLADLIGGLQDTCVYKTQLLTLCGIAE